MKADLFEACGGGAGIYSRLSCRCKVARVDNVGRLHCRDCGADRGQLEEHGLVHKGSSVQRPIRIRAY